MTEIKRLKKVINWLIFQEIAENERELSEILGYTKSSFSQIVNGKVPLSEKFLDKLCALDPNINKVWIIDGCGSMFLSEAKSNPMSEPTVPVPVSLLNTLKAQAESLATRDRQIDELIGEIKKIAARQEEPATSAAAV